MSHDTVSRPGASPRFYSATCQVGAEKAVKAEVLGKLPELRWAFARPGFVTFKEADPQGPALELGEAIFVRLWAEVLGQAKDAGALPGLYSLIPPNSVVQGLDRDECIPGDEAEGYRPNGHILDLLEAHPCPGRRDWPRPGVEVYTLVWVDDVHVFLTRHRHHEGLSPHPGNMVPLALPPDSPSRSYLKIEEAFFRFKPAMARGLEVLEVGCAPGGATTAMLSRGLVVVGLDPQHMAASVYAHPGFRGVRKQARYFTADDLEDLNPEWLVMDMSISPNDALAELAHVVSVLRSSLGPSLRLREGFLTLKLNDWKYAAQIPQYLERLGRIGFSGLRPLQLCANRQEFFVHARSFS